MANKKATNNFVDLDMNFNLHPTKKDVTTITGTTAIQQAVMNLLMTGHYERRFHPEIGCNIRQILFDPVSHITAINISRFITETLRDFEPRVQLEEVQTTAFPEKNGFDVSLRVFILNAQISTNLSFFLGRLR